MQHKYTIFLFIIIFLTQIFMLPAEEIPNDINETVKYNNQKVLRTSIQPKNAANTSNVRTNRQVHYNPQIFYIQNYINQKSECSVTYDGQRAICVPYYKCPKQKQQQQLHISNNDQTNNEYFPLTQHWPSYQYEICTYIDQYNQISAGLCCPSTDATTEGDDDINKKPISPDELDRSKEDGDSEILELPENFNYNIEPNTNNTQDEQNVNNIDYDPIKEWRRNVGLTYVASSYWPLPIWGFTTLPQWPTSISTLGPAIDNWSPQAPTHPPSHHYPTHPSTKPQYTTRPPYDFTTKRRPASTATPKPPNSTTKRPSYYPSNYPSYFGTTQYNFTTLTTTTTSTLRPTMNNADNYGLPLQCGLRNAPTNDQERIVGGTNASPHEFPWMAVIFKSGRQVCGGSLITNNHILTAAHCVARLNSWDVSALTVNLGDHNIRTDFEVKHVTRRVKRLVRHKGFEFSHLHNDISILVLHEPVKFTHEIQPLCLPTAQILQGRTFSGKVGLVAGWGSLRESGPQPAILQKVQVPIWTNSECSQVYGRAAPGGIISSMICAGQGQKDSCTGDSGGPMVVNEGGRYYQVGIVSWGIGCGKGYYPGVYTRVTSLLPWIYKNIKLPVN